jgi:hypothetical protein
MRLTLVNMKVALGRDVLESERGSYTIGPITQAPVIPPTTNTLPFSPSHPAALSEGIPDSVRMKLDTIASMLLDATFSSSSDSDEWTPLFEKHHIRASRKLGTSLVIARGESFFPYTIPEIYKIVNDATLRRAVDPNLDFFKRGFDLSVHTGTEYARSKSMWPTSARDFACYTQWRLLNNGIFLAFSTSEDFPDIPEVEGIVRANLMLGGYAMKHVPGGTQIYFVVQVTDEDI